MPIELIQGEEAYRQLADNTFRASYTALYDACPWSTAFQHIDFVHAWYAAYRRQYRPVLLCLYQGGHLSGALPLAQSQAGSLLVAGGHQAEYQCWLAEEQAGGEFLRETLVVLRMTFPGCRLQFRYLPAALPAEDLQKNGLLRSCCELSPVPRPLLDNATAKDALHGRLKTKLNGLKRLGDFRFERITDRVAFDSAFNDIILQHGLRQGVAKGLPGGFLTDPNKKPFHDALFDYPNLMHVTVLRVGQELAASHIGFLSRGELHLGVLTTNVFQRFARYSPGTLHLLLLAQQLENEGVSTLDLTPYGEFKERMATRSDNAHLLVLHPGFARLAYSSARNSGVRLAKRALAQAGFTPASIRGRVNEAKASVHRLRYRLASQGVEPILLGAPVSRVAGRDMEPGHRNHIGDLLLYNGQGRQQFLSTAITRLEAGTEVHSWVENGVLTECLWVSRPGNEIPFQVPNQSALIFDVYCASGDSPTIGARIAHVAGLLADDTEHLYILAPQEQQLLGTLHALGFADHYSLDASTGKPLAEEI